MVNVTYVHLCLLMDFFRCDFKLFNFVLVGVLIKVTL